MEDPSRQTWSSLASFVLRARRLGLFFVVLAILGTASLALLRFDFSPQTLFDSNSERARIYREYRATYGADDHVLMLMVEADMGLASSWATVHRVEERIRSEVPEVTTVSSLLSQAVPRAPEAGRVEVSPLVDGPPGTDAEALALLSAAQEHPLLRNTLVSGDGEVACLLLKVHDDIARLSDVKPVVAALRAIGADAEREGVQTWLLGPHAYRVTVVGIMIREELRFLPLTAIILALVLWLLFRSVAGVLVPLFSVGLGALWTLSAMALTGQEVNIINTITATLVLVIGIADAIHMMTRYGQERHEGRERPEAMRRALTSVGAACLLTSVTTAVGFLTLLSADLEILQRFGLYAAAGVMITFAFTIVFVPWALVRLPVDPIVRQPGRGLDSAERSSPVGRFLRWQAQSVVRRPRLYAALGIAAACVFAAGIPRATVDNYIMEYVPRDAPILEAHRVLEEKLAGVVFVDVLLEADEGTAEPWHEPELLARAAEAEARILADPGVQATSSVLGLLRELRWVQQGGEASGSPREGLPRSRSEAAELLLLAELSGEPGLLETHLSSDRRVLRLTARAADLGAREYLQLEGRMEAWLQEAFEGSSIPVQATITGTSQVGYGGIDSLIRDLLTSLCWAFGLIFLTLALLFRSLRLAALAMLPNVLPVVVVLGTMGWMGQHLETLSAMVFSIGLGIAVDDTIHYLARWRDEVRSGRSPAEAVLRTTERTGRAIIHTSLVLLFGFGVLYTSAFPPNQSFAVLAGGVIGAAVLADLWLLPALLLIFEPDVGQPAVQSAEG